MKISTKMSTVPLYIVEAFTSGNNDAYTGNPAAVCILEFDVSLLRSECCKFVDIFSY